jgi:large subunit ribosomal protein L14
MRLKERKKALYAMGTIHRCLVIRTKCNFQRITGIWLRFNENAVVVCNRAVVPMSNRIYGPVPYELCMK